MSFIDRYYEILGLKPGASLADIKQAYRELAKQWHPDRFTHDPQQKREAEEKLKRINEAYRYLKEHALEESTSIETASAHPRSATSTRTTVSAKTTNAEFWYNRGTENLQAGRYKQSLDDFSMAIRMNPSYMEAYRSRGFAHSMLGFELGAEADLQRAKQLELEQTVASPPEPDRGNPFSPPAPRSQRSSSRSAAPQFWHCVQTLSEHTDAVTSLALSREGKFLVSGSRDRTIKFWNLRSGSVFSTLTKHTAPVTAIALSPDGQLLASGSDDRTILLWDLKLGRLLRTLVEHTGTVNALAFSPDRRVLLSAGEDGKVCFWLGLSAPVIYQHSAPVRTVTISSDGQLAVSGGGNTLTLHQTKTGELLRTLSAPGVCSSAFSPNGSFATGGRDGTISLWAETAIVTGNAARISGHANAVRSLCFSPDGRVLASGDDDRVIHLWDANSGERLSTLNGHSGAIATLAFSADGHTLFSGSSDHTIKLWQRQ